jgi:hypothetical protein
MRAIRQKRPRATQILLQHTTRFQNQESSFVIPPSPPQVHEETLTIRLVFPGHELPNQDLVTPIMATIRQLKQQINALLVPSSSNHPANDHFITNTRQYVRPFGSTWTTFNRPGPISVGETVVPCASLKPGTILRVVPFFLPYSEDNKNDESDEEDNKSDEARITHQFYNEHGTYDSTSSTSDSSLTIHQRAYIRPEYGESNAESAARQEEIDSRIRQRQAKRKRHRRHQRKQHVQELTLEDINPHGLYANPIKPLVTEMVNG